MAPTELSPITAARLLGPVFSRSIESLALGPGIILVRARSWTDFLQLLGAQDRLLARVVHELAPATALTVRWLLPVEVLE